jgi:fatty-acyl-CoA synthase
MATALRELGVEPGRQVGAVMTNGPLAVRGLLATWLAGGSFASLPAPARGMSLDEYGRQLDTICGSLEPPVLITDERLRAILPEGTGAPSFLTSWERLRPGDPIEPDPPGDEDVAFIQYSSGSTSTPKGCMLSPRAIVEQIRILWAMLDTGIGHPDRAVCWLPLSHDMGMFGLLVMPWATGLDVLLSTPERFVTSPRTWFGDVADFRATVTAGPPSALDLAARASKRFRRDLSSLHANVIGAERIEWDTLQLAIETFAPSGMRPESLQPGYGLAEGTLGVAGAGNDAPPWMAAVDRRVLADGVVSELDPDDPWATPIVSEGPALPGVRIFMEESDRLEEIRVSTPSLALGYFKDPEATSRRFRDGVLSTGDLGFVRGDDLYVVGRIDDMISVGGRNVYARDIEAALGSLAPVRTGCCTVVDVPDSAMTRVVAVMELRDQEVDVRHLAERAAEVTLEKSGIGLNECVVVERGSIPKTASGKIQRFRCRALLANGDLEAVARVPIRRR